MKMFRELTRSQFMKVRLVFIILSVFGSIYYIFFTRGYLSELFALLGSIVAFGFVVLTIRHSLYDGRFKDDKGMG